jgi:transposase
MKSKWTAKNYNDGTGSYTMFVTKVRVLIFLCTSWESSTSLMYIGELIMTLAACTYLFKLNRLSLSWAIAVCVRSCFTTPLTFEMQPWYCSQRIYTCRQTDNHAFYKDVFERLRKRVQRVRKDIVGDWVLYRDKAPAHTALQIRDFLAKKNVSTLPHPPYSSDLAPCDFYIFPKLKSMLKGHHFGTVTDELWTRRNWLPLQLRSMGITLEPLCNFPRVVHWRRWLVISDESNIHLNKTSVHLLLGQTTYVFCFNKPLN